MLAMGRRYVASTRKAIKDGDVEYAVVMFWSAANAIGAAEGALEMVAPSAMTQKQYDNLWSRQTLLADETMRDLKDELVAAL